MVRPLVVKANVVPSSAIFVTLMMEVPSSFETSALRRATRRNISEDAIIQKSEMIVEYCILVTVSAHHYSPKCLLHVALPRVHDQFNT
jgi:hypothetical protein